MNKKYIQSNDFEDKNAKPAIVAGILIRDNKKRILLVTAPKFKGKWVLIGGHLDFGETLENCVVRESKEETGLEVYNIKFVKIIESIGNPEFTMKKHFVFINFSAMAKNPEKIRLSEELSEYKWFTMQEIKKIDMNNSTRETVDEFFKQEKLF